MKTTILFFVAGLLLGALATRPHSNKQVADWRDRWEGTRDAWIKDRQDWRNGKPFQFNYGPHGQRW